MLKVHDLGIDLGQKGPELGLDGRVTKSVPVLRGRILGGPAIGQGGAPQVQPVTLDTRIRGCHPGQWIEDVHLVPRGGQRPR